MFRYYLTQRPSMPGAFPKTQGNRVVEVENFGESRLVPMVHSQTWGYVEYDHPLSQALVRDYELREAGPFYVNKETGEKLSRQLILQQFEEEYDGGDPCNCIGWNEYYDEVV